MNALKQYWKTNSKIRIFLVAYFILTIIGILFSFLGFFIPALQVCLPLFGSSSCSPIGSYILIFLNLPGYIVVALLITNPRNTPELLSMLLVGGISLATYYFLGRFLDSAKRFSQKRSGISLRSSSLEKTLQKTILGVTGVLIFLFVYLLLRLML